MTSAATILASIDGARRASHDIHFEVEQFYYTEAELLDDGRFTDWLDLLADDLDYWMPTRTNRLRRQQALSISARGEAAYYDETKDSLAWRIRRFDSGMAWAEDPPSRTRHLVTNVRLRPVEGDELPVRASFTVWRFRGGRETSYVGGYEYRLVLAPSGLKIRSKRVVLDMTALRPASDVAIIL